MNPFEHTMMTKEAFTELFYKVYASYGCKTYLQAYEIAEQQHELNFGCRRYANYDSFRVNKYDPRKDSIQKG